MYLFLYIYIPAACLNRQNPGSQWENNHHYFSRDFALGFELNRLYSSMTDHIGKTHFQFQGLFIGMKQRKPRFKMS